VNTYLEVGSAMGATASVIQSPIVHCVDNWTNDIQPENDDFLLPINTKDEFIKNTGNPNIIIHDADFLSVDKSNISNVDMFFYDGPHDFDSTKAAVEYYYECLSDISIIIFDDANWFGVTDAANHAIESCNLDVLYSKHVLNEVESEDMWWNGLYIIVAQKSNQS
jgi:hypothetical protein